MTLLSRENHTVSEAGLADFAEGDAFVFTQTERLMHNASSLLKIIPRAKIITGQLHEGINGINIHRIGLVLEALSKFRTDFSWSKMNINYN